MQIVFFHANCPDGTTSAAIWKMKYPDANFIPMNHGETPVDVSGKDVVILDFSFKRPVIEKMKHDAKSFILIDHHITAINDLNGIEGCVFDVNECGASLTWKYLFPNESTPLFIDYIKANDLYQLDTVQFPVEFMLGLSQIVKMDDVDHLYTMLCDNVRAGTFNLVDEIVEVGKPLKAFKDKLVERHVDAWKKNQTFLRGYDGEFPVFIPVCNCSDASLAGDVCMKLASLNTFDENHAGATFNVVDFHKVSFSLRSLENGIDVSEIAKHTPLDFGLTSGGGHKHAAGMRLDLESLSKVITKFDLA